MCELCNIFTGLCNTLRGKSTQFCNVIIHKQFKIAKMKCKNFLPIITMLLIVLMAGCKKYVDPGVRPVVTSTNPINKAINVPINSKISVTFSVEMDPLTITTTSFNLKQGTTNVSGVVVYTGTTATFAPTANLVANTIYTETITTDVKDITGKNIIKDYVSSFTTSATADLTAPTVILTDPADNATGVSLNHLIVVTFSKPIDPATINVLTFGIKQGSADVSGTVTSTGATATFTSTSNLLPNKVYTGTITKGAKDMAGNALHNNFTFSFTSGNAADIILPMVQSTIPLNNATDVARNSGIVFTFSEAMDPLTINISTFTLMQGTTPVVGTMAYTGTTATFTPSTILAASTTYTATITTGAKDLAGNALAANTVWSFTTSAVADLTLPTVTSTNPLDNATGVAGNTTIAITFSKVMNPLTITTSTFTVMQGTNSVAGTVAYAGNTATFTPSNPLAKSTPYIAKLTTAAKDLVGNALAANAVINFTTGSAAATLAVVNLGAAANYVILAKSAISNVPTSAITGNLGLSPAATSFVTGFSLTNATGNATSPQITGLIYAADMAPPTNTNLTTAVSDMLLAYTDAAGRPTPDFVELSTGNIGGKTLTAGLYKWTTTVTMPSDVIISGSATDVWIFQISGNIDMSTAVRITLTGGAQAKNIFWQVAGPVTLGINSHFEGIILSQTAIHFQTGASINGRALAQTAVTLDKNIVNQPQ
jgi:hypothetical protein